MSSNRNAPSSVGSFPGPCAAVSRLHHNAFPRPAFAAPRSTENSFQPTKSRVTTRLPSLFTLSRYSPLSLLLWMTALLKSRVILLVEPSPCAQNRTVPAATMGAT